MAVLGDHELAGEVRITTTDSLVRLVLEDLAAFRRDHPGVVVDVGAALSHAIIVSRELGIPCVVSATDATRRIPDGALVRVDGSTGTVTVLE